MWQCGCDPPASCCTINAGPDTCHPARCAYPHDVPQPPVVSLSAADIAAELRAAHRSLAEAKRIKARLDAAAVTLGERQHAQAVLIQDTTRLVDQLETAVIRAIQAEAERT